MRVLHSIRLIAECLVVMLDAGKEWYLERKKKGRHEPPPDD